MLTKGNMDMILNKIFDQFSAAYFQIFEYITKYNPDILQMVIYQTITHIQKCLYHAMF